MAFVVPGVCRYTVNQRLGGRDVANIIDMRIDTTGQVTSREDALASLAGIIINEWSDSILDLQANDITGESVSWVDLNSATGDTGSRTSTAQHSWPKPGAGLSQDPFPSNVAGLVTKSIGGGRGRRTGRMYLAALGEGSDAGTPNTIAAANLVYINSKLAAFLGDINQSGATQDYEASMCVVHILTRDEEDNPLTGDSRDVTSLVMQALLATQRRRLRG